jgi:hypothetical protein
MVLTRDQLPRGRLDLERGPPLRQSVADAGGLQIDDLFDLGRRRRLEQLDRVAPAPPGSSRSAGSGPRDHLKSSGRHRASTEGLELVDPRQQFAGEHRAGEVQSEITPQPHRPRQRLRVGAAKQARTVRAAARLDQPEPNQVTAWFDNQARAIDESGALTPAGSGSLERTGRRMGG